MDTTLNPYPIALARIPGLGAKSIRQLLTLCTSPEEVFNLSHAQLVEVFGKHTAIIKSIESKHTLMQAEQELPELQRYGIRTLFFTQPQYPQRLNCAGCEDAPVLLYQLGSCNLNSQHQIAFVGARKCTDYGRRTTAQLVQEVSADKPVIVSGLAYGIDTAAHTAAVEADIPTVAVLGHGLDTIYPSDNRLLAKRILDHGGALLSEYPLHAPISPSNFPARNRIVAALSDAIVVVESGERGGALITANIAFGYHREVFAVPGRLGDPASEGCNNLIANNKALIIRNAVDLYFQLGWKTAMVGRRYHEEQQSLFASLAPDEQQVVDILQSCHEASLDELADKAGFSLPKTATILMNLELKKVLYCLPGRLYKLS